VWKYAMRKVTTRYVLTINPYQIVRENWVVGKILSLSFLSVFFLKKEHKRRGNARERQFCARPRQVVRSRKKFGWLKMNILLSLVQAAELDFLFFKNFFFPFLFLPFSLVLDSLPSLLRLFCLFLFPLVALCGFFD